MRTIETTDVHRRLTGDRRAGVRAYHLLRPDLRPTVDLQDHAEAILAAVAAAIPGVVWLRVETGFFEFATEEELSSAHPARMGALICRRSAVLRPLRRVRAYTRRPTGRAGESRRLTRAVKPGYYARHYAGVPLSAASQVWAWEDAPTGRD
ncbi:MAG: hypothetical protein A3K19_29730 [Lentisphaerae bacterium RIFOXYB12_FULL_65_16]|nr:MAG: hypothetical protein A3K18_33340 [Lentisphaerae bacterium RIFOXYA12_64_32]OGV86509.1 MAG: hypothetical protein A3K19_29730 [Lentisphaerae bacterium RIFOXYB12_FULL_65_16]